MQAWQSAELLFLHAGMARAATAVWHGNTLRCPGITELRAVGQGWHPGSTGYRGSSWEDHKDAHDLAMATAVCTPAAVLRVAAQGNLCLTGAHSETIH